MRLIRKKDEAQCQLPRKKTSSGLTVLIIALLMGICGGTLSAGETLTYEDLVRRLTDLEQVACLPPVGEKAGLASSYNRSSQYDALNDEYLNWDANADGVGCIRREGDSIVMAELEGAGCIWRIWSANANKGHVRIYLDGAQTPAIDLPFAGYFDGKNEPFTRSNLVYETKAKGFNNYTPIPFQKSCKIVGDRNWGEFYHFNYTMFPAGTKLPTFKLPLSAAAVAALDNANRILGNCGQDPAGERQGQKSENKSIILPAGGRIVVFELSGPSAITRLSVKSAWPKEVDEQRSLLGQLALSLTWDDDAAPAVWSPLGDFFGTAAGMQPFRSLTTGLLDDGTFYNYWYMPFSRKAKLEMFNDSPCDVALEWHVTCAPLTKPIDCLGRFHAKWHRDAFLPMREDRKIDWTILATHGRGRLVGVQLHVWNPYNLWWGEGDEKFFVDEEKFPSCFGTGTEDYFGYAWCRPEAFVQAFHSQTINEGNNGHVNVNRWHVSDSVPFQRAFEGVIEKYFDNELYKTRYAAVAYWYLAPGGQDPYPIVPASERVGWWIKPEIYREAGAIEGERMKVKKVPPQERASSAGIGFSQKLWSGDMHFLWSKVKLGDKLLLAFNLPWV